VRDRQYVSSLMIFASAVVGTLAAIVFLLVWLGWGGLVVVLTFPVVFLAWFYWGPRPDLAPKGKGHEIEGRGK
jgi:hypothetical protein